MAMLLVAGSIAVAIVSARDFFRAPTSLSVLSDGNGTRTAEVHISGSATRAELQELVKGKVVWTHVHVGNGTWSATLPVDQPQGQVRLLVDRSLVAEAGA
jgi:hypothetical protein